MARMSGREREQLMYVHGGMNEQARTQTDSLERG